MVALRATQDKYAEPLPRAERYQTRPRPDGTLFDPAPRMSLEDIVTAILGDVFAGIPITEELALIDDWVLIHGNRPEDSAELTQRVMLYRERERMGLDLYSGEPIRGMVDSNA